MIWRLKPFLGATVTVTVAPLFAFATFVLTVPFFAVAAVMLYVGRFASRVVTYFCALMALVAMPTALAASSPAAMVMPVAKVGALQYARVPPIAVTVPPMILQKLHCF